MIEKEDAMTDIDASSGKFEARPAFVGKGAIVRDVMNPSVLTFPADRTVSELAGFLTEHEISGVAVVDARHKLVGVVSVTDIAEQRSDQETLSPELGTRWQKRMNADEIGQLRVRREGLVVRDIMTPTVYTVPDETPVSEVALTMIAGRIHRLFVTRLGHVVGIVTTLDLLRLLCDQPDAGVPETPR
jgi:CBS domain-containing protein